MHTQQRTRPPFKLVLHDNEGHEGPNSAAGLRSYLLGNGPNGGGYQATFDDRNIVTVVGDDIVCYANGAINHESLDGCIVGFASQSAADWADLFDKGDGHSIPGAIENAAQWFALKCRQYGIPAAHLTGAALHDPNAKGICTHGDLTRAGFSGTDGHTDPGDQFPIDAFIARVANIISPPIDWQGVKRLERWRQSVNVQMLQFGDKGPRVQILNDLLKAHGFLAAPSGDAYGIRTWWGVAQFKKAHRWPKGPSRSGRKFGYLAASILLHG